MQQCLDKDLEIVVLELAFNNFKNIFELKDLARRKWDSIELWLVWNTYAHHIVTMVWKLIDKNETFVVLKTRHNICHCIHTM
jgi:hypothetical protein